MKKIYFNLKTTLLAFFTGVAVLGNAQVTITLGTGTVVGSTTAPGPINEYYRSSHCQMVYTKAEINAAGVYGGNVLQFGFNVSAGGGVTYALPNFTIKMKNTPAADVATYDGAGLATVYNTANYNPVPGGFDLLTLGSPFAWNGVDNILVDVCFDQVIPTYSSSGRVMQYSTSPPNSFIYVRLDSSPQCGVSCSNVTNTKPQAQMVFSPPPPLDLGVGAFLKPSLTKKCFGNDTIRVQINNYGSQAVDFSVNPTVVSVISTGVIANTYTLALNTGTILVGGNLDTTITTTYNMSLLGTYNLKGYTTVTGDGNALNDTNTYSVTKKAFFSVSTLPNDSICLGTPVQLDATVNPAQIGNGTLTNPYYAYPAPYGNYSKAAKSQFLFLASELTDAGIVPGNIQNISFNAVNLNGSAPLANFYVSIGTTTLTSLTTIQPSLTTVFSAASYSPTLGLNTHTFSAPFAWNGVDNVIIETCFNNGTSTTKNVSFSQSSLPFNASAWFSTYSSTTATVICGSSGAGASYTTERPDVQFGQVLPLAYSWTPGATLTATNIANPVANIPATTVFTVSLNYPTLNNCASYDTVRLFVKQTPTLNLGHDTTVCTQSYLLNGGVNAITYHWSTGDTTSTISVANTGTYAATATSSVGCVKMDTVHVQFNSAPILTLGHDTAFCQGSSIILNSGNPGTAHSWGKIGGGFSAFTQTVSVNTPGTYYAAVTSSLSTSCEARDTINIISRPKPTVSLVFNTPPLLMCQFSTPRTLNEGTPAGGTYFGPGVTGSSFDPAQVGPGSYVIVYTYTDAHSCSNQADDTLKVRSCTGIEEYGNGATLNVYPNPNTGAFTIAINSNTDMNAALKVLTIDGRVVYEGQISTTSGLYEKQVDISGLANGIYYLKMESANAVRTVKIVKQ